MQSQNFSIGIDIGGTNTAFGIVNRRGDILQQDRLHTQDYEMFEDFINALKVEMDLLMQKYGKENISGIGIGAPNANYYSGEIALAANLKWKGMLPLRLLMEEATGLAVTVTNDANATAIGEMIYGAAKGMKDFIIITLGTGVGSGFVANGQLIYGNDGFAGELGHVIAVRDGRPCGCGRNGCLETYSSATGIVRTAMEFLTAYENEDTSDMEEEWLLPIYKRGDEITSSGIHKAALKGDPIAHQIFDFTGKMLGQTLADAVAITSPEAIILFGGLAKAGDYILKPTKKYMEENLLAIYKDKIEIILSGLSERDAAILGASALTWG